MRKYIETYEGFFPLDEIKKIEHVDGEIGGAWYALIGQSPEEQRFAMVGSLQGDDWGTGKGLVRNVLIAVPAEPNATVHHSRIDDETGEISHSLLPVSAWLWDAGTVPVAARLSDPSSSVVPIGGGDDLPDIYAFVLPDGALAAPFAMRSTGDHHVLSLEDIEAGLRHDRTLRLNPMPESPDITSRPVAREAERERLERLLQEAIKVSQRRRRLALSS
jgi:hypothetical protein